MNQRKIWFAGVVTAGIGSILGLILARIAEPPYSSEIYRQERLEKIYMLVCGVGGLVVGTTQEALRQLQEERDREEDTRRRREKADLSKDT